MNIETLKGELQQSLQYFILNRVKEKSLADDILQEVYLKIFSKIHQLKDEKKIHQWVFAIARNMINDHFRKLAAERNSSHPEYGLYYENELENSLNPEVASWIPDAIELLPEKYRTALYLTEIEGLSQKELAEKLNISYSGAKSRVQRGRQKLKEIILECCQVDTDSYGNVLRIEANEKCEGC